MTSELIPAMWSIQVCCPNTGDRRPNPNKRPSTPNDRVWPSNPTTPRPSRPTPARPSDQGHANLRLLPTEECGVDLSQRIFGGNETELGEFPWMALLQYRSGESRPCVRSSSVPL